MAAVGLLIALTLVVLSGIERSIWLTTALVTLLQVGGLRCKQMASVRR
ncbi:MAG: hypothetical protein U0360_00680 [Dehalococcoidia bacterium]